MKQIYFLTVIGIGAGLIAFTGCKSEEPQIPERELYTSVPLYMAGNTIPSESQEKYLYNPEIKKYNIGRLVDQNGVMHENSVFYRIEKGPEWNLISQMDANPKSLMQQERHERYANSATGHIQRTVQEVQKARREITASLHEQKLAEQHIIALEKQLSEAEKSKKIMVENIKLLKQLADRQEKKINKLERLIRIKAEVTK